MPSAECESYEREIRKQWMWNFFANAADLSSVAFARSFIFTNTVLVLFTSYLTSSAVLIGLIPAIQEVGFLLPQLISARKSESLARKKPFVVRVSVFERLPYLAIGLFVLLWRQYPPWLAYSVLLTCIAIASGSGGIASPAWKAMLGKVIHPNRRGLLFSTGLSIGGFLGIGGAALAGSILRNSPYPESFGYCFLFAFGGQALSWFFLTLNREPPSRTVHTNSSYREYLAQLPRILKHNANFARYLIGMVLILMGCMGISFYIIYGRQTFGISGGFAASLTIVALAGQSLGTPALGLISDAHGHKRLTELSALLGATAALSMIVLPSRAWLYAVFTLVSLSTAGLMVSRQSITMEFSDIDRLPTYSAISSTILAIPILSAPLIGGLILDIAGFQALFAVALVFYVAGFLVMVCRVQDPRVPKERDG